MLAELLRLAPTPRSPSLTRDELRAAVVELQARGMRLRDIASAIGIAEAEVARFTTEPRLRPNPKTKTSATGDPT